MELSEIIETVRDIILKPTEPYVISNLTKYEQQNCVSKIFPFSIPFLIHFVYLFDSFFSNNLLGCYPLQLRKQKI